VSGGAQHADRRMSVCVVGSCDGLPEIVRELPGHDIHVLGTADRARSAAAILAGGGAQVVVYATPGDIGWAHELGAVREHTAVPIVVLSSGRSPALLDEALHEDVADALVLPQPVENVAFAIRRSIRPLAGAAAGARVQGGGQVVTVFSPKGGTGKTVIATNLAALLAGQGARTLLLDLDLQFGDAAIMLGIQPQSTLHDLVSPPGELDPEKLAGHTARHECGLDILAAPMRPQEADAVGDATVARLLEVAHRSYDVVVVDTAPFFHGPILTALDHTSELLLVCGPEVPALKNIHLSLETLSLLSFPQERVKVVLNCAYGEGGLRRGAIEDALGLKVVAEVPNERVVRAAVTWGKPAVLLNGSTDFAHALRGLSMVIRPQAVAEQNGRRWLTLGAAR
jgi:pilus assembly protein CpaE